MSGYSFSDLYGQADFSGGVLVDKGVYDAIVTKAEFGQSKGGDKDQWTVETTITTGQFAGSKLTNNITISPVKNDGTDNSKGIGIAFRHLRCLGVPVEVPGMPPLPQGVRNFFEMGWDGTQVAHSMLGVPVQIQVIHDEYEGSPRAKVRDYRPSRPGAPTEVQRPQAAPQQQNGYAPQGYGQPPQNYGQPQYAQQQYQGQPQYAAQPGYGQPGGQVAPGPWQQTAQQAPQGQPYPPQGQPGAGALGEPTGQGQYSPYPPQGGQYQSGTAAGAPTPGAPAPAQQGYGQQPGYPPQQGYGAPAGGAPAQGAPSQPGAQFPSNPNQPPWAQQPQGQPPAQQPQGAPQGDPNQAPPPPWAQ